MLRQARATGSKFLGCSRWPSCEVTAAFEPAIEALAEELEDLRYDRDMLRAEVRELRRKRLAGNRQAELEAELEAVRGEQRRLLVAWHPDRAGATLDATTVCQHVSALRDRLAREVAA